MCVICVKTARITICVDRYKRNVVAVAISRWGARHSASVLGLCSLLSFVISLCPSGPHALRVAAKRSLCRYTAIDVRDSPTHAFVASYRRHLRSTAAAAAAAEGSLLLNPQSTSFLARPANDHSAGRICYRTPLQAAYICIYFLQPPRYYKQRKSNSSGRILRTFL